jgi:hypothetical protein
MQTLLYVSLITSWHCAPGNPCSSTSQHLYLSLTVDLLPLHVPSLVCPERNLVVPFPHRCTVLIKIRTATTAVVETDLFQRGNMIYCMRTLTLPFEGLLRIVAQLKLTYCSKSLECAHGLEKGRKEGARGDIESRDLGAGDMRGSRTMPKVVSSMEHSCTSDLILWGCGQYQK